MTAEQKQSGGRGSFARLEVVGLSISRCILAMAEGKIPERVVVKIIGGTHFYNLDDLWTEYSHQHWAEHQLRTRAIFSRLVKEGRLIQPRLQGQPVPDTTAGIWKVGDLQMDTPTLQGLIEISDSFLDLTANRREDIIDALPQTAMQQLVDHLLQAKLHGFFPEFAKVAGSLPAHLIFRMLKDRLKQFFRTASEGDKAEALPAILQLLAPFFNKLQEEPPTGDEAGPSPFAFSQVRTKVRGRKPTSS